jgi:hypothetical protein
MSLKKLFKLIAVNIGLAAVNILLYSRLFLNVGSRDSVFLLAIAIIISLATVIFFFYYNLKVLSQSETVKMAVEESDENSLPSLQNSIQFYIANNIHTFRDELVTLNAQTDKFINKKKLYEESILKKFKPTEITYLKFSGTVDEAENVYRQILKGVLTRIGSFDEEEYESLLASQKVSRKTYLERKAVYEDYKSYLSRAVQTGDDILTKMDRLQLEVDKLNAADPRDLEKLQAVKEIEALISEVKWYK